MRTWNVPTMDELDVTMTAGGIIPAHHEGILHHDTTPAPEPVQPGKDDDSQSSAS